jgi:hypothetical protein
MKRLTKYQTGGKVTKKTPVNDDMPRDYITYLQGYGVGRDIHVTPMEAAQLSVPDLKKKYGIELNDKGKQYADTFHNWLMDHSDKYKNIPQTRDYGNAVPTTIGTFRSGGKIKGFKTKRKGVNQAPDLMNERNRYMQELGPGETPYDIGGWLKSNIVPLSETVAGGVMTATGVGAAAGIPLMATGAAGMAGSLFAEKKKTTDYSKEDIYPRTVGKMNMTPNVMAFKKGGKIPKKAFGGLVDFRMPANTLKNFHDLNPNSKVNRMISQDVMLGGDPVQELGEGGDIDISHDYKSGGKVHKVMHEFKHGKLHSGSKKGPVVKNRKQAIAIALSEEKRGKKAMGGNVGDEFDNQYGSHPELESMIGPSHEQGGIQISPSAEVEGGETKYKDVINSDRIAITKEIADHYGLPKGAIGKTPAQYSESIKKRYKGRENDDFAQNSKEMELNNIAKMSQDLAQQIQASNKKAYGGRIYAYGTENDINADGDPNKPRRYYNPDDYIKSKLPGIETGVMKFLLGKKYSGPGTYTPDQIEQARSSYQDPTLQSQNNLPNLPPPDPSNEWQSVPEAGSTQPSSGNNNNRLPAINYTDPNLPYKAPGISDLGFSSPDMGSLVNNDPSNIRFSNPKDDPTSLNFSPDKFSSSGSSNDPTKTPTNNTASNLLGAVPLAVNAFMAGRTANERPDKVKLGRVHPEDMHPSFIDPSYQIQEAGDTFNTANESMNQTSRTDYLRRRIQSATEESKVKSGIRGQVQGVNTQMLNSAKQMNIQNRMEASRSNIGTQMQEENINAANKGAWQTARDAQLSQLGTSVGEFARDLKSTNANNVYNQRVLEVMKNMGYPINFSMDPKGNLITNRTASPVMSSMSYDQQAPQTYDTSWKKNPSLAINPYTWENYQSTLNKP